MRTKQIFIGNINICRTNNEVERSCQKKFGFNQQKSELYKADAVLIKVGKETYIDLETIESHLDYLCLKANTTNDLLQCTNIILTTIPLEKDSLFVDEETLRPYHNPMVKSESVSIKRLKKEYSNR